MTSTEIVSLLGITIALGGALLAVSVTLVALVPTLIEIARGRTPGFLEERAAKRRLNRALFHLSNTVLIFGASIVLSFVGIFFPCLLVAVAAVLLVSSALVIQIAASYVVAVTVREVL